ncbi:hypothetical protein [Bacillus mesophilum]|uniref:Proteasome subunit beta n=1 Tax=Bacillus mesophilum TaxID=1071718 RepID=A0A7V7UST3_9BACI|nr:hypothetical protein [Bacillus mesophilum]KAB2329438.1 hypothetical protein F7732_21170 [Bacillus mesophilum]
MTLIVAYTWQDKIIIMADSRSSARNDEGKMIDYSDEEYKIIPVQNKIAIGHAGLQKAYLGEGQYFNLNKITEYFIEVNQQIITEATGEQLLTGLVEMWNRTLSEKLKRNPFTLDNRFSLLLAKFEVIEGGELKPQIHAYQSHFQEFNWRGSKAIIGDDAVYPIMMSYYETNTDDWTFKKTLDFYLKGFEEVMEQVETVGGPIDVYVLDAIHNNSYWQKHKPNN